MHLHGLHIETSFCAKEVIMIARMRLCPVWFSFSKPVMTTFASFYLQSRLPARILSPVGCSTWRELCSQIQQTESQELTFYMYLVCMKYASYYFSLWQLLQHFFHYNLNYSEGIYVQFIVIINQLGDEVIECKHIGNLFVACSCMKSQT